MQILVVGCGKIGRGLAATLSREDNNVTIVDTNEQVVQSMSILYDVMGVVGNGTSYSTLMEAGIEETDILIAVTQSDEVNLLTCVMARQKSKCHTIARVRNPIYSEERHFLRSELQLSMTINPELEAAAEIVSVLNFPNAMEVDTLGKSDIRMLRFRNPKNSMLSGEPLGVVSQRFRDSILVCIVERGDDIIIPNGDFILQENDIVGIIGKVKDAEKFFSAIGMPFKPVRDCMIVGGGGISYYLTKLLVQQGIRVKIVEQDLKRCNELSRSFSQITVCCGDGTDQTVLDEENVKNMDSFVACTGIDEINAILSLYANTKVGKVVTKMNHVDFSDVIDDLNLGSVVNPKLLITQKILQYVRATGNSLESNVESLYRLRGGRVEVLEFLIKGRCAAVGVPFADLNLKSEVLVAAIVRNGKLIVPGGSDQIEMGDSVIVVTTHSGFGDITDILVETVRGDRK
jgi:trk system potassium uptake protein TrkA